MRVINREVSGSDFIPPIVIKIIRMLAVRYNLLKPIPPFNYIPRGVQPEWMLDVGANHGDVTLAALKSFPRCKSICFEPVKNTFQSLSKTLADYADRVFLYQKALSNTNGPAEINITSTDGANSLCSQTDFHKQNNPHVREIGKERIEMVRLDDIAATLPSARIDILKIDVEGFEVQVLQGGKNFIRNNVDTILIEVSLQRDKAWEQQSFLELFNVLNAYGFRLVNMHSIYSRTNQETDSNMLLTQFDCVLRHKRNLQ